MMLAVTSESLDAVVEEISSRVIERLTSEKAQSPFLTTAEAAAYLCAKPQRVHDLLSARKLTRFKEGGRTLVLRTEVEALVRRGRD